MNIYEILRLVFRALNFFIANASLCFGGHVTTFDGLGRVECGQVD